MLQTLHLTKVYKTKGGADVKALDDVSISFPEKGMVFLLGKSGSGKSTLLNVCGGLDSPTSGEIIVKGRSSKAFSQSDFDSYRNTFVGFIFQEYNILNEFSVEDNIALALELQGKPKDKKVIAQLLEQVDLTGYAKRKPNTLSGGQKQRIAIARALVKSPEIIMADEPTGALDSATGKQVFDTLKKLSKDKLVIVVSHDRDFAETYGDRIIELKDGQVLSDVTKTHKEQEELTENIAIVGNTLCLKKGAELTEEDFGQIKAFLQNAQSDIVIAGGEKEVQTYKEAAHISESGAQEVFEDSEYHREEPKTYRPEDSRFIRSKLPLRHAMKIGVSSMKSKPMRLISTIFLCTVAFVFFGVLSTMSFYNGEATFKESLKASELFLVQMGKVYEVKEIWHHDGGSDDYSFFINTKFTEEDLANYEKETGKEVFGGVSKHQNVSVQSQNSLYWRPAISSAAYLPEDNSLRERITGAYPEKENEICISSYLAEALVYCKAYDAKGMPMNVEKPEELIGKQLAIGGQSYEVVGIMNSGSIPEKYAALQGSDGTDYVLQTGFMYELQDGLHQVLFVSKNAMENIISEDEYWNYFDPAEGHSLSAALRYGEEGIYTYPNYSNGNYDFYSSAKDSGTIVSLGEDISSLGEKEAILSMDYFCNLVWNLPGVGEDPEITNLLQKISDRGEMYLLPDGVTREFKNYTHAELLDLVKEVLKLMQGENQSLYFGARLYDQGNGMTVGEAVEYEVRGIWISEENTFSDKIFLADAVAEQLWETHKSHLNYYAEYEINYVTPENAIYDTLYVTYDHSDEQTNQLWEISNKEEADADGSRIQLTSALISNLETVNETVAVLQEVFLYAGLVLAAFAALLLSNFISISISYKKREIGILRAVGARSFDVFKIFFSESFVITAICVAIAWVGSLMICNVLNTELASMLNATLFVVGPLTIGVLIAVAFVTAVIATFLPVYRAARKKPVESIRAL